SRSRPGLPANIARLHGLAEADVVLGDEDVDGFDFGWLIGRLGFGRLFRASRQHGGNAARGDRNGQHDKTRGFHTLTLTDTAARSAANYRTNPHGGALRRFHGFDQVMVKVWLSVGCEIELIFCCARFFRASSHHAPSAESQPVSG